jgi:hypothetical protein
VNKHTPGPWEANKYGSRAAHWQVDKTDSERVIASMTRGEDAEANARLIAAAPELLEALEGILFELGLNGGATPPDSDPCKLARAAIAKAKGGA